MSTESEKTASSSTKKGNSKAGKKSGLKISARKPLKPIILFALIKLSGIGITEASGKLGGNVFSRTKGGTVIRNRVVPNNPQTIAQQAVRAIFGAISSAWRALSEIERNAWNEVAIDYPYQNALGETKILSGKALFQKLNNNRLYAGLAIADSPSAPAGTNAPVSTDSFDMENNSGGTTLTTAEVNVNLADDTDNVSIVVLEATAAMSQGVKNANNRFVRVMQMTATAGVAAFDFATEYQAIFGVPAAGSQVQIRAFSINPVTGEKSAVIKDSTVATNSL